MQELPHHHLVTACAEPDGNVVLKTDDVPQLVTAPPAEFGGPGDQWSPETLLVSAVLDGFIFSFRAISQASKLEWCKLECSAEGTVERVDRANRFTTITVKTTLTVPADTDTEKALLMLEKSESACLINRSLSCEIHLEAEIIAEE